MFSLRRSDTSDRTPRKPQKKERNRTGSDPVRAFEPVSKFVSRSGSDIFCPEPKGKREESRNSCRVSGGGVDAEGMVTNLARPHGLENHDAYRERLAHKPNAHKLPYSSIPGNRNHGF